MAKHLITLPTGTSLPDVTGLPEGYPFLLQTGTGSSMTRVLHQLQGGTFLPITSGPGRRASDLQLLLAGPAKVTTDAAPPGLKVLGTNPTIVGWSVVLGTAPAGSPLTVTLKRHNASNTYLGAVGDLTIAAGTTSASSTLTSSPVALATGEFLHLGVSAVGSNTPGSDLLLVVQLQVDA